MNSGRPMIWRCRSRGAFAACMVASSSRYRAQVKTGTSSPLYPIFPSPSQSSSPWLRQAGAPLPPLLLPRSAPPPTPPNSPAPNHVAATLLLRRRLFSGRIHRPACRRRSCHCRHAILALLSCCAAVACSLAGQGQAQPRMSAAKPQRRPSVAADARLQLAKSATGRSSPTASSAQFGEEEGLRAQIQAFPGG